METLPSMCHIMGMTDSPLESMPQTRDAKPAETFGGGVFIGLGTLGGAVVGTMMGEASAGLIGGMVLGFAAAGLTWLKDRRSH